MVKPRSTSASSRPTAGLAAAQSISESARQTWLAGIDAFQHAQSEGGKLLEALLRNGLAARKRSRTPRPIAPTTRTGKPTKPPAA